MASIKYTHHSINEIWRKSVENNPRLSDKDKKELIKEAHKSVVFENFVEVIIAIVSVVLGLGLMALVQWIFSSK
jgi:hypothetical protein